MVAQRLATASVHCGRGLPRAVERIGIVVAAARKAGADLLVLPDAALDGYLADLRSPSATSLPRAIDRGAPEIKRVAAMAGEMVICFGYTELIDGQRYNAAICLNGDGVLGRYRKVHQPPGEALVYSSGDRIAAFDTPVGRMGMLIDYDKTFPEAARTLALDDARIIACLCAWPASFTQRAARLDQDRQARLFDLYDSVRAAENQIVWISANQSGSMGSLDFLGQSKIVGPGGNVLARTGGKAGLVVAELDVDAEIDRARVVQHHLQERRPEHYLAKAPTARTGDQATTDAVRRSWADPHLARGSAQDRASNS